MIVLDTNVVSELLRVRPDPAVRAWASRLEAAPFLTAVTTWELRYGVRRLPAGQRRDQLASAVERVLREAKDAILPFDDRAAVAAADVRIERERAGRPAPTADVQIAGICRARGATLATRNIGDFDGLGLALIDPWSDSVPS